MERSRTARRQSTRTLVRPRPTALPDWATQTQPQPVVDEFDKHQEVIYLNLTCHKILADAMDTCLQETLQELVDMNKVLNQLLSWSEAATAMDTSDASLLPKFSLICGAPDTHLLPVLVLKTPFAANDTKLWLEAVEQAAQARPNCSVQYLKSLKIADLQSFDIKTFDEFLVILDVQSTDVYTRQLEDLLGYLVERRSYSRIPVSLVLYHSFRRPPETRIPLRLEYLTLPSPADVLNRFWHKYRQVALHFPPSFAQLRQLAEEYALQSQSAVGVLEQLQRDASLQLAPHRAFVSVYPYLLSIQSKPVLELRLHVHMNGAFDDFLRGRTLRGQRASVCWTVLELLHPISEPDTPFLLYLATEPRSKAPFKPDDKRKCLERLTQHRSWMPELMVLLEHAPTLADAEFSLKEVIWAWMREPASPTDPPVDYTTAPQPRRDQVQSVLRTISTDDVGDVRVDVPCYLYRIVKTQTSISESDWFHAFSETFPNFGDTYDQTSLFRLFAVGVRHLQAQGLIRMRPSTGKTETSYERTAIVWCSGD